MSKCSIQYAWKYHAYWILHSDIDFDGTCGMQDINHTAGHQHYICGFGA